MAYGGPLNSTSDYEGISSTDFLFPTDLFRSTQSVGKRKTWSSFCCKKQKGQKYK